eukprot:3470691-Pleurochrysis_carterae.AAC.1
MAAAEEALSRAASAQVCVAHSAHLGANGCCLRFGCKERITGSAGRRCPLLLERTRYTDESSLLPSMCSCLFRSALLMITSCAPLRSTLNSALWRNRARSRCRDSDISLASQRVLLRRA